MEQLIALEKEVRALQEQNRKLRWWLLFTFLLAGLPYLLATQTQTMNSSTIRAERFEVIRDGKVVATLDKQGLTIRNEGEKAVAWLWITPDGGHLSIRTNEGKEVAMLGATPSGGRLGLWRKTWKGKGEEHPTVDIWSSSDGSGVIAVTDGYNNLLWRSPEPEY